MSTQDWVVFWIFFGPVGVFAAVIVLVLVGLVIYSIGKGLEAVAYSLIQIRAEWRKAGSS